MDLASSQGDQVAQIAQVQDDSDNTGGAEGEKDNQPGSKQKVDVVVSKLATQMVNKLTSQADNFVQASKDIKTLAEAVKCLREDMKSLKRKQEDQGENPPAKRHADTQGPTASTSQEGNGNGSSSLQITSDGENTDSEDSEDELDKFLEQAEESREDNPYAELEDFFQVEDGTGEAVGDHIAGISNRALRGTKNKKEEEKFQKIMQKHLRPKNIENLQVPKVDDLLWRQLKRDVKQVDYVQQQAVAAYGQAMVPLIKIMEATEKHDKTVNIPSLVSDTFKMLSWNIKQTNLKRLERIQKELQPKYRSLCQEGPSATKLLGDNFQEAAKKQESTKGNLTVSAGHFLGRKGGDRNQSSHKFSKQSQGHGYRQHQKGSRYNNYHHNNNSNNKGQQQQNNFRKKNQQSSRK